jgi:hypothetical protein
MLSTLLSAFFAYGCSIMACLGSKWQAIGEETGADERLYRSWTFHVIEMLRPLFHSDRAACEGFFHPYAWSLLAPQAESRWMEKLTCQG